ncbi:alpha,alpha-trehalose-phosphate synthase (UDP-forming) [Azospirillum thermophilum]|uniref:Trehalose-6-phosphate synthase n=1 Tax=Azospirillum thermophilum TaxID=2202148 RepID=A0A2S2CS06_9PROT|nr:alpha,alpha-trehalose-phosphate synthase (UDP-forming) [Azospirillum thermophilum]AWK87303.1 alpha,alpha-trehalose-phosphate synthase (UDP-forming) [Azospirillum thermophilum]
MSRLVVVSNRVAPIDEGKQTAGGLAVAVLAALKKTGGIWFGWSGNVVEGESQDQPTLTEAGRLTYATLDLGRRDHDEYYNGFANQTLWPLFHFRLGLIAVSRRTRQGYERVNAWFADRLHPLLRPDDMIWVHDYHLIPFGEELRRKGCTQRMGFFLHTPFPPPELITALPNHADLIRELCAYDLVGFHTVTDLRGFLDYIRQETDGQVEQRGDEETATVRAFGRTLLAKVFPISIDTAQLESIARTSARSRQTERLRESLVGRRLIIGVDRLDYSKGLPQRFEAFEQLLLSYPEHCNRVTFLQVAPPSREDVPEYIAIRRELSELAGRINGRFAEFDWMPIRYLNRSFGQRTLAGFYRAANVGFVTPLRDGMNLVAKEYVACQDPDNPGVLVLSQFAGAARELEEALIVNPFDVEGVADALQRALTMPLPERKERHGALMRRLRNHDIGWWRESYVDALTRAPYD